MTLSTCSTVRPSVWIGCLACYNTGSLVGNWYPAEEAGDITPEDIHDYDCATGHEELWVFDHEGFPEGTGEMSPMNAVPWGELFADLQDEDHWEPLVKWYENGGHVECSDDAPDCSSFLDHYQGHYPSFGDYLSDYIDQMREDWPEEAVRYFDYDQYERDASFDYTVLDAADGGVYVFSEF